jgi:hypothetical protein
MRFPAPLLFGSLLLTGVIAAQTPDASQAPTQTPAQVAAPPQQQVPPARSREEQEAAVKAGAAHMADLQVQAFARQLNLTAAQVARIRPILDERDTQLRSLVLKEEDETPTAIAERQAKALKIQQDTETRVKAILTPTQRAQYERLIELHRAQRSRRSAALAASRRSRMGIPAPVAPADRAYPADPSAAPAAAPEATPPTPAAPPAPPTAPAAPPQPK